MNDVDLAGRAELAYQQGRRDAEREAFRMMAAVIATAGGQVTVPERLLVENELELVRFDTPDGVTFTARSAETAYVS